MKRAAPLIALATLAGCDTLLGTEGQPQPLVVIRLRVEGRQRIGPDVTDTPPRLRVALLWGAQIVPTPLCILPPESEQAAKVLATGCPDLFRFVPERVAANAALDTSTDEARIELFTVPSADVMIGDITSRVVYGSLVLYDDRDGDGALALDRSPRRVDDTSPSGGDDASATATPSDAGPAVDGPEIPFEPRLPGQRDVVYAASFVSMTEPDQRLAFREGKFNDAAAYYPRNGCAAPPPGFSLLGAGGFSAADALVAAAQGKLPQQAAESCTEASLAEGVVVLRVRPPEQLQGIRCRARSGGQTRYRAPPAAGLVLDGLQWACVAMPWIGIGPKPLPQVQLVVATPPGEPCRDVIHYTLRGCRRDASCDVPDWDLTKNAPSWWPCPASQQP
ncbi:MAG: hypothetical protein KC503_08395 [Myxococcales bacterium]|nr:hypothetical protein [Myxococcales bacterium]